MIALQEVTEETPKGTIVVLIKDNGAAYVTVTRSDAWWLSDRLLVQVAGLSGGYLASRCHVMLKLSDLEQL